MGGASGGGSFGSSGSAFGSSGSMFGSSGSAFSGASGSTLTNGGATGTANGSLIGLTPGGMYGGTGYGAASRGGTSYNGSSQYGNRAGQSGQYGGAQGRGGGSRRGGQFQGQGQPGQGGTTGSKDQQVWFEPRFEVGFAVAGPGATAVQTNIANPLHTPSMSPRFGSVKVSVQGSMVTLQGTVSSEEDRLLAAQMAMLEPAVASVQNDLIVAAPSARPPR